MLKVNYCGKAQQEAMVKRGWFLIVANFNESPEQLYERMIKRGYTKVKVYWCGTQIKGLHDYFAFVKR